MMEVASVVDFLTGDAVEGELLADKMAAGRLRPAEALRCAIEVGRALVEVHQRNLVYGSLSPDHVLLASDGAHLLDPAISTGPSALRYRSPEQVFGSEPDWRSDIFSFGVLLYEMASGQTAFPGRDLELDDAILHDPIPVLGSKSPIHLAMERVSAACTEKNPSRRRQRMQNAVIDLKLASRRKSVSTRTAARPQLAKAQAQHSGRPVSPPATPPPASAFLDVSEPAPPSLAATPVTGRWRWWMIALAVAALALLVTGVTAVFYLRLRPAAPVVKFSVIAPEHTSFPGTPAVSPDGSTLTFSAVGADGHRMLWLRALDEVHARMIPGTEGGFAPFWSPDNQWIAFFANKELRRIHIKNGPADPKPEVIAAAGSEPGGGSWSMDGVILFAPGLSDGLYRVSLNGGKVSSALAPVAVRFEHAYLWPQFLPDGKHFIFFNRTDLIDTTGIYAGSLDTAENRLLFPSDTNAVYAPAAGTDSCRAYLLYMKERQDAPGRVTADLMGRGFNSCRQRMEGEPIRVADDIGAVRTLSLAPISVSSNAVLVYQTIGVPTRQLIWLDRRGQPAGVLAEDGMWGPPRIAPDGSRVVVGKMGRDGVNSDLWLFDSRGGGSEFVQTPNVSEGSPVWSPDGARIAYWSNPDGPQDLFVKPVNGGKADPLYKDANNKFPVDWSRDGRFLLFDAETPATKRDIFALSLFDRHAAAILGTIRAEGYAALSPDGKWLAYQSDESGRFEVYVQPFEGLTGGTKRRWKVSSDSGNGQSGLPRWRADGRELFYMTSSGTVMSANITTHDGEFSSEVPKVLFQTRPAPKSWNLFDVSPDGERLLLNLPLEWSNSSVITVMTNWNRKLLN